MDFKGDLEYKIQNLKDGLNVKFKDDFDEKTNM